MSSNDGGEGSQRFQHTVRWFVRELDVQEDLNRMQASGWELVAVLQRNDLYVALFYKRPVQS